MDIRERHFGRIFSGEGGVPDFDVGALVRRLILFEHCTVESNQLLEVPALIRTFGYAGLVTLLESGAVSILCDAMTAGQVGQNTIVKSTANRGGPLPFGCYRVVAVKLSEGVADRERYVSQAFANVDKAELDVRKSSRLKALLRPKLLTYPAQAGPDGVADAQQDILHGRPVLGAAIQASARQELGEVAGTVIGLEARGEALPFQGDVRVVTNLAQSLRIPMEIEHRIVERAILAVAGLNQRLHLMDQLRAVTGFQDDDLEIFETKVRFLVRELNPDVQEERFDRIVTIAGLPSLTDLPADAAIDVKALLALRDDKECRGLRQWIRSIDTETDDEINERFTSVRERMAELTHGRAGRAVRLVLTTGAGYVPVVGPIAGPIVTGADRLLVDKLIGKAGPSVLLGRNYRSIFER